MVSQRSGLSTAEQIELLADQLSAVADAVHMFISRHRGANRNRPVSTAEQQLVYSLFQDELELRQRANHLYADAPSHIVSSIGLSQAQIASLTARGADKIRKAATPREIAPLVSAFLMLAQAVKRCQSTSIEVAFERIRIDLNTASYAGSYSPIAGRKYPSESDPYHYSSEVAGDHKHGETPKVREEKTDETMDEGREPVRFPSIESDTTIEPGASVVITVDLLHAATPSTMGSALALELQTEDWSTLELGVTLVSAGITFPNNGKGSVTIRRNLKSIAARFQGSISSNVIRGQIVELHAQFWDGTRCCGSAIRRFEAGATIRRTSGPTFPTMTVPITAAKPDVTIYITLFDPDSPGSMHWRIVAEPFDGLPPKLDGIIKLGHKPSTEAAQLFKEFANLPRGGHQRAIEGFGERLWKLSPPTFKAAYWALHDHYQRPLTIQFTSDDPHLPWELMRPLRENEAHEPIAERHAVARWIGAYQGWLKNELPAGALMVVAPRYSSVATRLSLTETAAAELIKEYNAIEVPGTVEGMLKLLESPPSATVGMVYFSGHGRFNEPSTTTSAIKLEGGGFLHANEVDRDAVQLGKRHGSIVFFNACEVGATGAAFGEVGGWADAFLARQFRAFIAPLWAIDEEDAAHVTRILIDKVIKQCMPIGEALRDIRRDYGHVSPTFYSYLLYGDVTARVKAGRVNLNPSI